MDSPLRGQRGELRTFATLFEIRGAFPSKRTQERPKRRQPGATLERYLCFKSRHV